MLVRKEEERALYSIRCEFVLRFPSVRFYDLMDSHYFYTTKPLWVGDFGTKLKSCLFFRFGVDFGFVWLTILFSAHADYTPKKFVGRYSRTLRPITQLLRPVQKTQHGDDSVV
jgi:hypothetical protein